MVTLSRRDMLNYLWFFLAALFEIAGCFAFFMWLRQGKSALWVIPALLSLTLFALLLTRVEAAYAGRAYAAYGGIYIVASIAERPVSPRLASGKATLPVLREDRGSSCSREQGRSSL